ncbi:tRNA lysidine(34) synthetase TilS [Sphingomonas sp.]|uniref:tRNA lysidine(34) synthetase TilS n=1 Tax=Sphingomonas sp. TaxID=28214 RepID=UPI002ED8545C
MTLDPAAVERFRRDLRAALRSEVDGAILALAVSGGPDSMAMLALAHAAFPDRIVAATVDHGLRAAAAQEAAMVAEHCGLLHVSHATLRPAAPIGGGSIQARAREARYALLLTWALEERAVALLTAHHVEDQAETFLMRAARGSGVAGLAGIRPRRDLTGSDGGKLALVRPLLTWRRAELRAIAEASGPFADDPSNRDPAFDRSRFRQLLADSPELEAGQIAATATYAAEAQQALDDVTALLWKNRADVSEGCVAIELGDLNRELRRRLARRAIGHLLARPFDADNIEPLLDAFEAGKGATRAGAMMSVRGNFATFRLAPPRRSH